MAEGTTFVSLKVSVVSPSGSIFEGEVASLKAPAHDGLMGIMPGHAPLLGMLGNGLLTCYPLNGKVEKFVIDGGFLEVAPGRVTILANHAENLRDVDVEAAKSTLSELQATKVHGDSEIDQHMDKLEAARVRIRYGSGEMQD